MHLEVLMQEAYRTALAEKQPGGWDALCAAAKGWKQPVLRGKKYETLRDDFPDIRKSFEKSRDEAKKIFTDARDRYLAETEASVLEDIRACSATVRRYVDLTPRRRFYPQSRVRSLPRRS